MLRSRIMNVKALCLLRGYEGVYIVHTCHLQWYRSLGLASPASPAFLFALHVLLL